MSFRDLLTPPGAEPIRADVTPLVSLGYADRHWLREDTDQQARIRKYDREGPGITGAMLDIPAGLSAHVTLKMQVRTPRGWEDTDDAAATAILNMWHGEHLTQTNLLQRMIRMLDGAGELAQVLTQDPLTNEWAYALHSTTNLTATRYGQIIVRTRPNAREGSQWYREVDERFVQRLHNEDNEWPGMPWSPMMRALPHIETYRKAMRTIGRNMDSQLAMNGIMWAKATAEASNWPNAVSAWAKKAVDSDDGVEAVSPFLLQTGEKPEWIDVGRGSHSEQIQVADYAVLGMAQASDLPTKMVVEGPGSANHWNEIAISDWVADFTMFPRLERACAMITAAHWRPWAKALSVFDGNPRDYRVWFDDSGIRGKTDKSDDVLKLREMGIATREAAAEAKGLRPDQIMDLPEGVSDYEDWVISRNPGALPVTTGEDPLGDGSAPDGPPIRASLPTSLIPR